MRLVIISDTHGKHEELGVLSGDVLIHCGDFCDGFKVDEAALRRIDDWFARQSFSLIMCVGGNHDFAAEERFCRGRTVFENAVYLQDSSHSFHGVSFYGAPWVPMLAGWAFYLPDPEISERWRLIPAQTDVLITHTPPWRILDSPRVATVHAGCPHLRTRVEDVSPRIHCFGHNHASHGRRDTPSTTFLNASVIGVDYHVTNSPFVIELES